MPPAVEIYGLGKRYRLGLGVQGDLRESVTSAGQRLLGRSRPARPDRRELWALRDVDLVLEPGESLGLIGHNGAGKSTLLKILSRITPPTTGRAVLRGRLGSLLEVGTGFHPELTGRENIFLNGAILGMQKREISAKFDDIVEFAELSRFIDTPVKRYSSGMYVRLAFSVAAHVDLDILLVDEVLAVGDVGFQRKCIGKMGDVIGEGRTVVFVSHNMTAINQLCRRGIVLTEGRVTLDAPVGEAIAGYLRNTSAERGERRWTDLKTAPGDARFRLLSVRMSVGGKTTDTVEIDKPLDVEVEFEALSEFTKASPVLYLLDGSGNTVLSSTHMPGANALDDDWSERRHEAGIYRSRCTLPGSLLNNGRYYVSIYMVTFDPMTIHLHAPHAVGFDVFDGGSMRFGNFNDWHGVVRLPLEWTSRVMKEP